MQYCSLGTLEQAVKRGVFVDAATGAPNMVSGEGRQT